ncbi:MAG: RNA-binding domain-containing protein [Bacteroidota bacterium]
MDEKLVKLSSNPVFADLTADELNTMMPIITRATIKTGEIIFDLNKKPENLYFVESGSFQLKLRNNEYKTLREGELIGEIGIIDNEFRTGIVTAAEDCTVIKISGEGLFHDSTIPSSASLKILMALSKRIIGYLKQREHVSTKEIIQSGEGDEVEFKSTLRWNLYSNKKDKAIEKAVLKTLVAFLNTNGGLLLVGVADDGSILGLEADRFENHDKLQLHLTNMIKDRIGPVFFKYINFSIESIDDKDILRIECNPCQRPAYFRDDQTDHFFIRSGPATIDLRLSRVFDYINARNE